MEAQRYKGPQAEGRGLGLDSRLVADGPLTATNMTCRAGSPRRLILAATTRLLFIAASTPPPRYVPLGYSDGEWVVVEWLAGRVRGVRAHVCCCARALIMCKCMKRNVCTF